MSAPRMPRTWQDARPAPPCTFVIFGAAGDLSHRLLTPALLHLAEAKLLDDEFRVLGFGHKDASDEAFRDDLLDSEWAKDASAQARDWLRGRMFYVSGDFEDPAAFARLHERLRALEDGEPGNIVFYFATGPQFFAPLADALAREGLLKEEQGTFRRVVIEKPFGRDLASARELNRRLLAVLDERQIYRIDHFLGKETVQNIMALRFANTVYEPLWNRQHITRVEITAAETVGVEERGKFYDSTGALRDMVPNHMFQLLAMTAMEAPNALDANAIRAEAARVLAAVRRYGPEDVARNTVRGQYAPGIVEGREVRAYRDEPNVSKGSQTETYVALRLFVDNWRWAGVPFFIRTGKAMAQACTRVTVHFDPVPHALFPPDPETQHGNVLVISIKPVEGLSMHIAAKHPGPSLNLAPVRMDFNYADYFQQRPHNGYETLIYDCLIGDQTLFRRADHIEASWGAVQPILDAWKENPQLDFYAAGSWGPKAAQDLMAREGGRWRDEG